MGRDVGDAATSQGTPRTVRNQQQLGEAREGPLLQVSDGALPCPHPDFRPLASRTASQSVTLCEAAPGHSHHVWVWRPSLGAPLQSASPHLRLHPLLLSPILSLIHLFKSPCFQARPGVGGDCWPVPSISPSSPRPRPCTCSLQLRSLQGWEWRTASTPEEERGVHLDNAVPAGPG